jgi:hypothetical protein
MWRTWSSERLDVAVEDTRARSTIASSSDGPIHLALSWAQRDSSSSAANTARNSDVNDTCGADPSPCPIHPGAPEQQIEGSGALRRHDR